MGWIARILGREAVRSGASTALQSPPQASASGPTERPDARTGAAWHRAELPAADATGGYAVVDVETTGLSPRRDRIVSVGVVLLDPRGRIQHEWTSLVNPQGPVGATHIHGIRDVDVADAPTFDQLIESVVRLLAGRVLAGHNVSFDAGFLKYEFGRAGWGWPSVPTLCTMRESTHFLPHLDRRRLADCCWATGIPIEQAHSALHDARATAHLLAHYLDPHHGIPPLPAHHTVLSLAASTPWPSTPDTGTRHLPEAPRRILSDRALHVIAHRPPALGSLLERFTLTDALDDGATSGSLSYLETLVEVLEDGHVTAQERATLSEVAELYDLSSDDIAQAHRGFVRALAREALEDGHLARAEKSEISRVAELLDVPDRAVRDLINGEEQARLEGLSAGLTPLPDDWPFDFPLRVGDRVAFTGCDLDQRDQLERQATERGVRVLGNVSRRTVLLITDGTYDGNKARAAAELGTRVVQPDDFLLLLDFIQPWRADQTEEVRPERTARPTTRPADSRPRVATAPPGQTPPSVVRAWAIDVGLEVGVRGRLSAEVWDAYAAAHPELTPAAR